LITALPFRPDTFGGIMVRRLQRSNNRAQAIQLEVGGDTIALKIYTIDVSKIQTIDVSKIQTIDVSKIHTIDV
jgi:hypothetical protein